MPLDRFLLFVAVPVVLVLSVLEAWVLSRRQRYDWRAMGVSMVDLSTRIAVQLLLPLSIATPVLRWAEAHRVATLPLDGWQALVLLFIGQEFCYYWYHRAAHRVRWFWGNHSVHHSPNELNLSAAYRIGPLGRVTGATLFFVPLAWLGFDTKVVLQVLSLNLLYQFWLHTTWIPRLGWLEYVFNTPSAHRVHHAANPEYLDANYGGVLIVFDRLFGTYVAERADLPCRYGLVVPMQGYNPLKIQFGQWVAMARDVARARSLRAVLGHLFGPPGWAPDGPGNTTAELRRRHLAAQQQGDAATAAAVPAGVHVMKHP
jgi:sterol desaturase/sphingolipid hydroxylase (fatty acid hydroxylase superfamily)